jgi:hypothetical protein
MVGYRNLLLVAGLLYVIAFALYRRGPHTPTIKLAA